MHNPHTRKIVEKFETLVDYCILDEERKQKRKAVVDFHRQAMNLVTKQVDLNDEEIKEYQQLADKFFKEWVSLYGRDGMTNYIHMVGSGHIADFLIRWRCLYRHSQQGWEALNNLIKTFLCPSYTTWRDVGQRWGKVEVGTSSNRPLVTT